MYYVKCRLKKCSSVCKFTVLSACHFLLTGNCSENVKWTLLYHASLPVAHSNTFSDIHWLIAFLCTFHCKAHEKVDPWWRHKLCLEVQVCAPPHFWNGQCRAVTNKVILPGDCLLSLRWSEIIVFLIFYFVMWIVVAQTLHLFETVQLSWSYYAFFARYERI